MHIYYFYIIDNTKRQPAGSQRPFSNRRALDIWQAVCYSYRKEALSALRPLFPESPAGSGTKDSGKQCSDAGKELQNGIQQIYRRNGRGR